MKRSDCWMTFTQALEQYLCARVDRDNAPTASRRYNTALEAMSEAARHMDVLTGDPE